MLIHGKVYFTVPRLSALESSLTFYLSFHTISNPLVNDSYFICRIYLELITSHLFQRYHPDSKSTIIPDFLVCIFILPELSSYTLKDVIPGENSPLVPHCISSRSQSLYRRPIWSCSYHSNISLQPLVIADTSVLLPQSLCTCLLPLPVTIFPGNCSPGFLNLLTSFQSLLIYHPGSESCPAHTASSPILSSLFCCPCSYHQYWLAIYLLVCLKIFLVLFVSPTRNKLHEEGT